jgi:O-methyltransferase
LNKLKDSFAWHFCRNIKLWLFSFRKGQEEVLNTKKQNFITSAQRIASEKKSFFIQGRMDIDPLGFWHNPEFVKTYGGFFPKAKEKIHRDIVETCPYDMVRRDMIILLLRTVIDNNTTGEFAEVGVYQGETAKLIHHFCPERKLSLFDTFEGFDERDICNENAQIQNSESIKDFKGTSTRLVHIKIAPHNNNVKFFKGYFPESVHEEFDTKSFAFVHLDVDLYQPTKSGLDFFYPKMSTNGIILIHDFNAWPGVRKAVVEFLSNKKEIAIPMPDKSGSAIIVKQ